MASTAVPRRDGVQTPPSSSSVCAFGCAFEVRARVLCSIRREPVWRQRTVAFIRHKPTHPFPSHAHGHSPPPISSSISATCHQDQKGPKETLQGVPVTF